MLSLDFNKEITCENAPIVKQKKKNQSFGKHARIARFVKRKIGMKEFLKTNRNMLVTEKISGSIKNPVHAKSVEINLLVKKKDRWRAFVEGLQ